MEIKITRIRSSRSIRLRVLPDGTVAITCHPSTPLQAINRFVAEHRDWIDEKTSKIRNRREALTSQPTTLLFRGREYGLKLQVAPARPPTTKLAHGEIVVTTAQESHEHARTTLEKWYKREAKVYFSNRVPLLCDVIDHDILKLTIRSQRTRWGSCSNRKTISLNWRLILAPDWVSDYVIYHEIAHLTHLNHSRQFWRLVEDYYPRYRDAEKWLKDHHQLLHF